MAHKEQTEFVELVKSKFPKNFNNCKVVEFGSLNINGTIRILFQNCDYIGVDLAMGEGVDIISKCHEFLSFGFDTVISCEMLEHDPFWIKSLRNMYNILNIEGLMVFSCATIGRHEHGTLRTTPEDSPFTASWDYYMNLEQNDIEYAFNFKINDLFEEYHFSVNDTTHDLYFYGIKKESNKFLI